MKLLFQVYAGKPQGFKVLNSVVFIYFSVTAMLSINSFEEELREEYGKIFSNIAEIKAAKKRRLSDEHPLSVRQSFTEKEKLYEARREQELSGEQEVIPEAINSYRKIQVSERDHETPVIQRTEGQKTPKLRDREVRRSSRHLPYDKVAMDLEAFFNKHMVMDSGSSHTSAAFETGKELENIKNGRDEAQHTQIRYKTVHTRKDTLYIWIASVWIELRILGGSKCIFFSFMICGVQKLQNKWLKGNPGHFLLTKLWSNDVATSLLSILEQNDNYANVSVQKTSSQC